MAGEVVLALVAAKAAVVGVGELVDALPEAAISAERALGGARAALVVQKCTCVPAGLCDAHSAAGRLLEEREPLLALVVGAGAFAAQVDRPPQTSPLHRQRDPRGLFQQEPAHAVGIFNRWFTITQCCSINAVAPGDGHDHQTQHQELCPIHHPGHQAARAATAREDITTSTTTSEIKCLISETQSI